MEIERKFLVRHGGAFKRVATSVSHIQQGYIPAEGATVRIRRRDDKAYLTIKSHSRDGIGRYEFEKEITLDEAQHLMALCRGGVIDKHRWLVPCGNHVCEVDEFHGTNEGLVMAEIELRADNEPYDKPDFLGPEVTGDAHFYNSNMLATPYSQWKQLVPEEYR